MIEDFSSSVRMTKRMRDGIDKLVVLGYYRNRAEFLRAAVLDKLVSYAQMGIIKLNEDNQDGTSSD